MDNKLRFKIVLDESGVEGVVISVSETQNQPLRVASAQEQGGPHYSGRVVLQSNYFMVWESPLTNFLEEHETDPCNYNKAIQDKDVTLWKKAMKTDMESLYSNQVWFLVKPLDGVKLIGYKWIYKRKRMIDRKVNIFQALLMTKGSHPLRRFLIPSSL